MRCTFVLYTFDVCNVMMILTCAIMINDDNMANTLTLVATDMIVINEAKLARSQLRIRCTRNLRCDISVGASSSTCTETHRSHRIYRMHVHPTHRSLSHRQRFAFVLMSFSDVMMVTWAYLSV